MEITLRSFLLILTLLAVVVALVVGSDLWWMREVNRFADRCAETGGRLIDCNGHFSGACRFSSIINRQQLACFCPAGSEWDLTRGCITRPQLVPDRNFLMKQYAPGPELRPVIETQPPRSTPAPEEKPKIQKITPPVSSVSEHDLTP
jgi:hypothetical protein